MKIGVVESWPKVTQLGKSNTGSNPGFLTPECLVLQSVYITSLQETQDTVFPEFTDSQTLEGC